MPVPLPADPGFLPEEDIWEADIYQIETDDEVIGGVNGISNIHGRQLANRTLYLKGQIEAESDTLAAHVAGNNHPLATTGAKGMVVLATTMDAQAGTDAAKVVTPAAMAAAVNTIVNASVAALVNSSPATLDTLAELATALGNDANFAATITAELAAKAPLDSAPLTGTPTAPTAAPGTNSLQLSTTAFVHAAISAISTWGAGHGLEDDGGGNLRIKLNGLTLVRSDDGVKVNLGNPNTWIAPQTPSAQALTDATTVVVAITAQIWTLATAAARAIAAPTGGVANTTYRLVLVTGGFTPIFNLAFKFPGGIQPAALTGTCIFDFFCDGASFHCVGQNIGEA